MVDVPDDEVTVDDLKTWYQAKADLSKLKVREATMRSRIFKFFFRDPKEGNNDHELKDGTDAVLKGDYVINRSLDIGAYEALKEAQKKPDSNALKINLDVLVRWKPEVNITEYRKLTAEEQLWFDQCLVIKPGSPQLEIVIPKRAKAT